MADWKLRLYHHMPPFMRNFAATMRGYQLRSWRYSPETEQLVQEALERDSWSAEQWRTYQENRLVYVLHRAATQVPYYRQLWSERRRHGDRSSWEQLENWPVLYKSSLRQNTLAFVADDRNPKELYVDRTSGTTGTPLQIYISKENLRHWYALFEARWRRWYGLSIKENWGILGGQQVVPAGQTKPPFWVWNGALQQLYLSSNHVSSQSASHYLQAMIVHRITHLYTYTSSATFLAEQLLKQADVANVPELRAIITNAEPVFDWQRKILGNVFRCSIYETYGMGEMVLGASADELHRLRLWPEPGYLEVIADDTEEPVKRGEIGRLVSTSFLNTDMPLVRYEIGDRSGLSVEDPSDTDAVRNPIMLPIQGRSSDMLVARNGRRIFWINPIFYEMPIVEAQIIQDSLDHITVRYVPELNVTESTEAEIRKRLAKSVGEIDITFEKMQQIPRGPNGKFRAVISNLPPEEHAKVSDS